MFSYSPPKLIPYIIIFSIKAPNSGNRFPLPFIILVHANSAHKYQTYSLPKRLIFGIGMGAIQTLLPSGVCFV